MNPLRRLIIPVLMLLSIIGIGIFGFSYIEKWPLIDSIYMVVITLSTVGFREVHPLNTLGKIFTMGIIVTGVGAAVYTLSQIVEMIVEGEIIGYRRRKKMEKKINGMKDHYIICGFGRVGHQVAAEFDAAKIPYMVIDNKPETATELDAKFIPYIIGDGANDAVLENAGIKRAKGMIAANDSDTANVYVTLSARVANPSMTILARAGSIDVEEKLKKAGANRVISPYFIAGKRLAAMVTKPIGMDFLDTVLHSEHLEMEMREFDVDGKSHLTGKTLGELQLRQKSGAYIVAIRGSSGTFNYQPVAESKIETDDILVAIGTPKQLDILDKLIK
ncbi:potassium channel protein [Candidatus Saganbacteria bacterium]|nr:potassium channel protein [Candidatus Saganbacteria bacterium]